MTAVQETKSIPGVAMQVVARSSKLWSEEADKAALRERTTFVGGDFFKSGELRVCSGSEKHMPALPAFPNDMQLPGCNTCPAFLVTAAQPFLAPRPL